MGHISKLAHSVRFGVFSTRLTRLAPQYRVLVHFLQGDGSGQPGRSVTLDFGKGKPATFRSNVASSLGKGFGKDFRKSSILGKGDLDSPWKRCLYIADLHSICNDKSWKKCPEILIEMLILVV